MRAILHGDVTAAARVLLLRPPEARPRFIRRLLSEADGADRYRKRTGRAHPHWGNGCLMAAALKYEAAPEPFLSDRDYAECMVIVLEAIIAWRSDAARGRNC